MKNFIRFIIFSLLIIVSLVTFSSAAIAASKELYVGAYIGGDSAMPPLYSGGGAWDNDLAYSVDRAMVAWQGENFAVEQTFMAADDASDYLDVITWQQLELMWYYGRVPMVNLSFYSLVNCQQTLVDLASNLNNPAHTDYLRLQKWAQGVKTWLQYGNKRFLILAFVQEANYSSCYKNDPSKPDYVNPAAFINVYRSGKDIVDAVLGVDASRVQWAFAPNNESNQSTPPTPGFEDYYPGDDVVDWLGLSTYNFGIYHIPGWTAPWMTFDEAVRPYLDRMRILAPQKPLALFQIATTSFGGDKNLWIQQFIQDAIDYPYLFLVIYFNTIKPWDGGLEVGLDWPVFWNDAYSAPAAPANGYGPVTGVSYPADPPGMRYPGWLTALLEPGLIFSPIREMPTAGVFASSNWNMSTNGPIRSISDTYDLLPELKDGSFLLNNGCAYAISPSSLSYAPGGGSSSVSMTSLAGCNWTAVSNAPSWIHVTSGSSGSGNGTISYSVDVNSGIPPRAGTIAIGDRTFSVNQAGVSTTAGFTFSPAFGAAPLKVFFIDTSSNADSWSWNFGDGTVSSSHSPSHTFSDQGIYIVTLTTSNINGFSSISKTISSCGDNPAQIVRIPGSPYSSFLNAYAAATVAHDEIRMHAATLVGGPLDGGVPVTLVGGNDCSFNRLPGLLTTLSGLLTISGNSEITFDGIIIQ